ncbi:hypothetical protein [Streptomyces sp. E-08]|uniref:hypothetical protein n=1 Tax=Streptomyces sp. E-08 TaxID=3404047 RepID=UPI003CF6176F
MAAGLPAVDWMTAMSSPTCMSLIIARMLATFTSSLENEARVAFEHRLGSRAD